MITKNDILEFLQDNGDIFVSALEELDNYSGYLGDDRLYTMEEFDEIMSNYTPWDIARAAYYGGDFRPCDNYFGFNGYGNLKSTDYPEDYYNDFLDEYFVDELLENYPHLYLDDELREMLESYDNENDNNAA